jgi:hypothetical protein
MVDMVRGQCCFSSPVFHLFHSDKNTYYALVRDSYFDI